jgi:hypothetical protein
MIVRQAIFYGKNELINDLIYVHLSLLRLLFSEGQSLHMLFFSLFL